MEDIKVLCSRWWEKRATGQRKYMNPKYSAAGSEISTSDEIQRRPTVTSTIQCIKDQFKTQSL